MGVVHRLDETLCNQIAAGEVVERPASVVKELVENSIDAGASRINVEVGGGGISLLRVTDDGHGMDEHDAQLALERHATSKIAQLDDLLSLASFGFRGEALPSIASVSLFALRTRKHDSDSGVEIRVEGGSPLQVSPCGMAAGTIVEVRELFYNVPARRKFLKSPAHEAGSISTLLEALALASPSVTIMLQRDGRRARQWLRAPSRQARVLEARPDQKLAPINGQRGPLTVEAFLSPPELARAGAVSLTVFVNGRLVTDRVLARIVARAYGSVLEQGRYPAGVLYLDIDPRLVDVNVHPQKAEVRFADTRAVHGAVYSIVAEGLASAFGLTAQQRQVPAFSPLPPVAAPSPVITTAPSAASAPETNTRPITPSDLFGDQPDPWGLAPTPPAPAVPQQGALNLTSHWQGAPAPLDRPSSETSYGELSFLAQVRNTYLICESTTGVVIIDQHAAAERVNFHRLRHAYHQRAVASQRLLIAASLEVDGDEAGFIEEQGALIEQLGMEMRMVGPTTAAITAVPQIVARASPERLGRDLLDELAKVGERSFSGAVDRALATMACHGSVRAGDPMTAQEVQALLQALDEVDYAGHCPHGRPLLMRIGFEELERGVGRR